MKRSPVLLFLLLLTTLVHAQVKVDVYADVTGNDSIQKAVDNLRSQLERVSRISITVSPLSAYKNKGIFIARIPATVRPGSLNIPAGLREAGIEAFSITGNSETVQLLGNSHMALGHAVFAYLESLGFRYYFANPDWHIIPTSLSLYKKINLVTGPSFMHRRIWYGYGTGSEKADADYNFWKMANRLGGSMNASFGHSYDDIVAYNPEAFTQHPEWLYPKPPPGKAVTSISNPKFDVSNEELVQFVIQDVMKRIEKSKRDHTSEYKMISLGPSDGGGTCNTPACQRLGTLSDRVYYLVNRVAAAVRKKYPDTWIGSLAYTEYIEPPTRKTEPNVYVSITTAFNPSKYSVEQLVEMWSKKAGMVGIYDFFALFAWDFDLPGQSQMSNLKKVIRGMRTYYKAGAKGYEGESSQGWVSKGLGHYICAKLMWDINTNEEAIRKEFFDNCFGKASDLMKKLWNEWENYAFKEVREGDLLRWIDWVFKAVDKEPNPMVVKRLYDVKAYLHYLALFRQYRGNKTSENLGALLNFGYRLLDRGSIAGFPASYELGNLSGMPEQYTDNPKAVWKANKTPVPERELNNMLARDRMQLKPGPDVQSYEATSSGFKKIPNAEKYTGPVYDGTQADNKLWYQGEWLMQVTTKGPQNFLEVSAGYVEGDPGPKPVIVSIYPYQVNGDVTGLTPLIKYECYSRAKQEKVTLDKLAPGYYTVIVDDPAKIYTLRFSQPVNYSMVTRPNRPLRATWGNNFLFYVPAGTKSFNVMQEINLTLRSPKGRIIDTENRKGKEVLVDVQPGEEGLWKISFFTGDVFIEGVPPYLGVNAAQMLIPSTVN